MVWRLLLAVALLLVLCPAQAATPEKQMLSKAINYFKDKFYFQAEMRFNEFVTTYTNSPERPAAILYQARCRLYQSNYLGALELLQVQLPNAGKIEDQYHYWIAESLAGKGDFKDAVATYSNLIQTFPKSERRLASAFGQAQAYSKLGDWQRVSELLSDPHGVFQTEAQSQPGNDFTLSGQILLGEALFAQQKFAEAEHVVSDIQTQALTPPLAWHRQHLLCRLQLARGHVEEALQTCTNRLFTLMLGQPSYIVAESYLIKAEILERLERWPEAIDAYTNNLSEKLSPAIQRQALFKTINLTLKQNQPQDAIKLLETFTEQRTNDPSLDLARLMLGELALKAWYARTNTGSNAIAFSTNLMAKAMTNFDRVIQEYPNGPLLGKAYLDQGWCNWAQTNLAEAAANFQAAVDDLSRKSFSEDLAVARFKLGDVQFALKDFGGAITNYSRVLDLCEAHPELKPALFDKVLYQLLRSSIERNNEALALETVKKIVTHYPPDTFNDEALLLYGEFKTREQTSEEARRILTLLLQKFPGTRMRAEVEYAIARTYAMQQDWPQAARSFTLWSTAHGDHPLLPQAEFSRALAYDKGGDETNAFILFTNYITRFQSNQLAAWAQNWVADYYFNSGRYADADLNYQELLRKFPNAGDLIYQARLMSGRSAYARQGPLDIKAARDCFIDLAADTNTPSAIAAKSWFALGDINLQLYREEPDSTNRYCDAAVNAFKRIPATNSLAIRAQGRIGDCLLEWFRHTPPPEGLKGLSDAITNYSSVVQATEPQDPAHSQALIQLGLIAELQTNLISAQSNYAMVLYETPLDRIEPVWANQAGVAAARLYESQGQWAEAIAVYNRILTISPSLKPVLEKKIANANAMLEASRK
jgi:TolA-binding protein